MNENAPGLTAATPKQAPPTIEGAENRCDREFFNDNQDGGVAHEVGGPAGAGTPAGPPLFRSPGRDLANQ
jgi:hypothetical protein